MNGREVKEHKCGNYYSMFGRSTIDIECPWCGDEVVAYVWSLAGSGKRCCTCKNVIHYTKTSARKLSKEELEKEKI